MLSDYIYNNCFKKVPYTGSVYELDCNGNLRNSFTKKEVPRFDDEGIVRVTTRAGEWFDGFSLAVLLGITHRNVTLPIRLLSKLEVIYKDGDRSNFRLTNTVWKCPQGELSHPDFPGFCYIPGYSRYLINKNGELLSPIKGELLSPYSDANGYLMYGVQPDVGKRTIVGMHRLISLAWIDYPANVDKLDINHRDTVKSNNALDNLEWATRSRNNFHAHENGLSNSIAVKVRNIYDGEVTTYYSMKDAARSLGINDVTLRWRAINGKDGRVYDGFQYKLESDKTPWVEFDTAGEYRQAPQACKVLVVDNQTEKEHRFDSISKAALFLDVNSGTLRYHLSRSDKTVVNDFLVSKML